MLRFTILIFSLLLGNYAHASCNDISGQWTLRQERLGFVTCKIEVAADGTAKAICGQSLERQVERLNGTVTIMDAKTCTIAGRFRSSSDEPLTFLVSQNAADKSAGMAQYGASYFEVALEHTGR
jgi:hypothetical protein